MFLNLALLARGYIWGFGILHMRIFVQKADIPLPPMFLVTLTFGSRVGLHSFIFLCYTYSTSIDQNYNFTNRPSFSHPLRLCSAIMLNCAREVFTNLCLSKVLT